MFFLIFVYVLGVSSLTTVGTDIFQIVFTAGYGAITQYAIYGFIFYTRRALEERPEFGGEDREVAVIFVDVLV